MLTSPANLNIYQGDDFGQTVTVLENAAAAVPVNLAGWTGRAQIRKGTADRSRTVVTEFKVTITDPAAGAMMLVLTHDQTKLLAGHYVWDLELVSPAGLIATVLAGNIEAAAEVTRK